MKGGGVEVGRGQVEWRVGEWGGERSGGVEIGSGGRERSGGVKGGGVEVGRDQVEWRVGEWGWGEVRWSGDREWR